MSLPVLAERPGLAPGELVAQLDDQIASARRLLQALLAQTDEIRAHRVEQVLLRVRDIQAEVQIRMEIEVRREELLDRAAAALGVAPETVDLQAILVLVAPDERQTALTRSAELKGLVKEIERAHHHNRILIRQELAFIDHLLRALSGVPQGGYTKHGAGSATQLRLATLDLRA